MIPIASLLPRASAFYPERAAIRGLEGTRTYAALFRRVRALAGAFQQRGLKRGDRVAVLDNNSAEFAEAYYACCHAGLILVPLNARAAGPELLYQLNDAGARGLCVGKDHVELAHSIKAQLPTVEWVVGFSGALPTGFLAYEAMLAAAPSMDATPEPSGPDDIALIYYTSGTTGEPKGVCLTHGNMIASALDSIVGLELNERDTWLHAAPMFHLVDAWAVWAMPLIGGSQAMLQFAPDRALAAIEAIRPTATSLAPIMIDSLIGHPGLGQRDLSSLRVICYGGAPTPLTTLQRAAAALPARLAHGYGTTEASGTISLASAGDFRLAGSEEQLAVTRSAGRALAHIEVSVLDANGEAVLAGQPGEIAVSGARVMKGYWQKPRQTAEALRNGAYHTGDIGYLDEQRRLYIVDRLKDMIITGGENVYPIEVERVIQEHPAVREVAVIGLPSEVWGEAVTAIIVPKAGARLSETEIITFCEGRVANYKKPKRVFFQDDELPKTGPGKLAKAKLRTTYGAYHADPG